MSKTKLRVFPAISRNIDSARYIDELMRAARFSDRNGLAGILLINADRRSKISPRAS